MGEAQGGQNRKAVWGWALYDWANSAFATTVMAGFFPVFFKKYWSAGSAQDSTFWLGVVNSGASLLIAALAPVLGAIADRAGAKKGFLVFFAFLGAVHSGALWMVQAGNWPLAAVFYAVSLVGFSGANTFYDALLVEVSAEKTVDRVSSLGYAMGYLGGGLLFAVNVLMYLKPALFGLADPATAVRVSFLMVGVWWALYTVPLMIFVKEAPARAGLWKSVRGGLRQLAVTIRAVSRLKQVGIFLLAYWLYIDGVDTIIRMAVDYGVSLNFPASSLITALLIVQFVAFPFALLFGRLAARIGQKAAILIAIAGYSLITIFGVFMTRVEHFYILAMAIALFQGAIQAISRSFYTRLIPADKAGEYFGFFNMLGKFAAIIGPLLIGVITVLTRSNRLGMLSLLVLFAGGGVLLAMVKPPTRPEESDGEAS